MRATAWTRSGALLTTPLALVVGGCGGGGDTQSDQVPDGGSTADAPKAPPFGFYDDDYASYVLPSNGSGVGSLAGSRVPGSLFSQSPLFDYQVVTRG